MSKVDKKLLIVEDDNIARDVLELILKKHFTYVLTASNGEEGLALSKEYSPDIVVADLAMPVLDGFAMIKQLEKEYPETPIIIVTAYREEAEACGDYIVLHKPVDRNELLREIYSTLEV